MSDQFILLARGGYLQPTPQGAPFTGASASATAGSTTVTAPFPPAPPSGDAPWTLPAGSNVVVNLPSGSLGVRTASSVSPESVGITASGGVYTMNRNWDESVEGSYLEFGANRLNVNGKQILGFRIEVPNNITSNHLIDGNGEIGYFEIRNPGQYSHNSHIRGGKGGALVCHHYIARGVVGDCQKVGTDTRQEHYDAYVEMDVRPGGATDKHYDGAQVFFNGDCVMERIVVEWNEAGTIANTTGALFTQNTAKLYARDFLVLNPGGTWQPVRLSGSGAHDCDNFQVIGPQGANNGTGKPAPSYCVKITNGSGTFTLQNDCPGSADFLVE